MHTKNRECCKTPKRIFFHKKDSCNHSVQITTWKNNQFYILAFRKEFFYVSSKPYFINWFLRNYYDDNGKQFVQVVNFNEDGDNKNLPKDKQFEEHTHDYIWNGKHFIRPKRRLNDRERKENSDILWENRKLKKLSMKMWE